METLRISYIDQFPEPTKYGTRKYFYKDLSDGLEESKNKIVIKFT